MDNNQGRLVSGDRFGLKMWDLLSLDQGRIRGNDYMINLKYNDRHHHHRQQRDQYTTTSSIANNNNNSHCPMKWLQIDHDKILALLMDHDDLPYFKIWSFDL
ncbi:unnamed protein product [Cunninghamella blakesleeana]